MSRLVFNPTDLYSLHLMALAKFALQRMMEKYPDMLPEELMLISLCNLLEFDTSDPMGVYRQQIVDDCMEFLKVTYGDEVVTIDRAGLKNIDKLNDWIKDLSPPS